MMMMVMVVTMFGMIGMARWLDNFSDDWSYFWLNVFRHMLFVTMVAMMMVVF